MPPILLSRGSEAPTAAKICKKGILSLISWRSCGMCSHVKKVSHCFHAVFSLRTLEVERPSVTAL